MPPLLQVFIRLLPRVRAYLLFCFYSVCYVTLSSHTVIDLDSNPFTPRCILFYLRMCCIDIFIPPPVRTGAHRYADIRSRKLVYDRFENTDTISLKGLKRWARDLLLINWVNFVIHGVFLRFLNPKMSHRFDWQVWQMGECWELSQLYYNLHITCGQELIIFTLVQQDR